MKVFPVVVATVCALLFLAPVQLSAQSQAAAAANEAAYNLFSSGNYAAAAAAYEQLLKDFPTDAVVPIALVQLSFCQFFLGNFDAALATLAKTTSGPPLPPDVAQVADSFLPQILSAKASAMPPGDAKRKATFEEAVKKFSDFITKYPQSPELENAVFGRALANFQIEKFDEAATDLEQNVQRFAQSGTIASSKNLLALTLATQGGRELARDGGDRAKGMQLLTRAESLLREIIAGQRNIGLINDSYFQIGEILFTKAAFSPEAERPALYEKALEAYRSIIPKEEVVRLQQERIAAFPGQKAAALRANNATLKRQLDKDNERELRNLAEIQAKPDQVATAILKMGEIFFNAQQLNQARTVIRHITPHLTTDDAKMRAAYFQTMTYALQNMPEQALAGYNEFVAANKGNPLADNLPFAIGNMFLALGRPTDAIQYFDESIKQYPTGRLAGLSVVSKAQAEVALQQFDSAQRTFQEYLAKNPPPEVAVVAQYGLAGIYKDTGKWDDAIAAYQKVKSSFPNTPQAIEADYWIAISTQQKGDNAAAVPLLEAFTKGHPEHQLTPLAIYALGGAQLALGQKDAGVTTLASLAAKFPDSPPAPYTYFMRAQIAGGDQKVDEVVSLMRQFIEKYPQDEKVYFAYDSIAQSSANFGKPDEAIAAYTDFAEKYPDHAKAAEALTKAADLQRGNAERLAMNYASLEASEQTRWKDFVQQSVSTLETALNKYPESPDIPTTLQSLLNSQRLLLRAELRKPAEVEQYYQDLADKAASPAAKSKILFSLASYIAETEPDRALTKMQEAYNPELVYGPKDLDVYGLALVDNKKFDEATAVFEKLRRDYPNPPGVPQPQIPLQIQEAQAIALFGLGRIAQENGQTAEAGKLFQQLKTLYPWSPKVLEADYGIAQSLKAEKKLEEAQQILTGIIRAPTATAELRANSFLLSGDITEQRWKDETDAKKKSDFLGAAIDQYLKIAQFYGGVPEAAATGLWRGGQLLETQANESTDAKFKAQQLNRARDAYRLLIKDYPASPFAQRSQERLTALGPA